MRPHDTRHHQDHSGFQSTHPSGVRRHGGCGLCQQQRISIHAPQWGATGRARRQDRFRRISIHAPQWGATTPAGCRRASTRYFNPRTPVGCDRTNRRHPFRERGTFQSTHPSGVRHVRLALRLVDEFISIHAPQWGATRIPVRHILTLIFQSTHPSGVRLQRHFAVHSVSVISIHAPQWGATFSTSFTSMVTVISIHAPQWGATV